MNTPHQINPSPCEFLLNQPTHRERVFVSSGTLRATVTFALLAIPWLNPFAPGPSPAVVPWLVALMATACLLLVNYRTAFSADLDAPHAATIEPVPAWAFPVAAAWLFAGLLSSLMGVLQYFGAAAPLDPWVNQTMVGEAFANLRQRNQFASLTNIALAALVWMAFTAKAGARTQARQIMLLAAAACLAVGNVASSSRTGLVQLLLLCMAFWMWGGWRQQLVRRILVTALMVYGLAMLVLPWLGGFDLSEHGIFARLRAGDGVCAGRLTLWSNVLHLIAQKPWLGWGWGELDYAHYITLYDGPRFCEILDNAHNLPLQLAVELGVPAALLLCGGFAVWVVRQRPWRERHATRQLAWAVLGIVLLHSMLEYPLWYAPFQVAVGLCLGLLWLTPGAGNRLSSKKYLSNRPWAQVIRGVIAMLLIAIAEYGFWDYHRISQIYLAPESRDAAYREDTLAKINASWLFSDQVRFAELILTPLTPANAEWTFRTASALLHYSPEPRVIEKVIESAVLTGRDDEAIAHLARFKAAFAQAHARWAQAGGLAPLR